MKKSIFTLLLVLITLNVKAQEESKQKELGFNVTGKLGFAKLNQSGMVLLNGSINAGDVLFFYRLPSGTTFSTGIGLMDFNANGVSAGESYALKQSYLRIPINLNYSLVFLNQLMSIRICHI
jgi:hypothetical protein